MKSLIVLFLISLPLFIQSKSVIKIIDLDTKLPVKSVNVKEVCLEGKCKDSTRTLRTNKKGEVALTFNENCLLIISHVGYKTLKDTVNKGESKTIALEQYAVMMKDIVTTGQFVPQSSQNSVFPVKVIDKERIQLQATNNLKDLFNTQLNIKIQQDNVLGSGMSINGVSGQNVKIMIDGVPVIGRLNGNIDISQINLNNVERVEIVEGPMSTIYGTDALGGVVNIITKNNYDFKPRVNLNSYYEGVGHYNFDGDFSINLSDDDRISLNGGRWFFQGYSPIDTGRSQLWKPKEQYFADLNYNHSFDKLNLRANSRFFYEHIWNKGAPREPYYETAFDDHYRTYRLVNSIYCQGELFNNKFVDLIVSYSNYFRRKNTFLRDLTTLQDILTNSSNDQDTSEFNNLLLRGTYSSDGYLENLSYQMGFDINFDDAKGARIDTTGKAVKVQDYAVFTSLQYIPLEHFTIQPAVRLIYNSLYQAPIIPSLNMKYEFTENLKLRASYSRGFRAPTLRELYFFFVDINHNIRGNKDLKAENSNSYNLALSYNIQRDKSVYQIEPKLFYNDINDQINLAVVSTANALYSYVNIGNYKTAGGELQVKYILDNFNLNIGTSYIGRRSVINTDLPNPGFRFSPEVTVNTNYDLPYIDTKLNVFYKFSGRQPGYSIDFDGTVQEYEISSYHMMDASLNKLFWDKKISATVGIRNLMNVINIQNNGLMSNGAHSGSSSSLPVATGRNLFMSLKVNL